MQFDLLECNYLFYMMTNHRMSGEFRTILQELFSDSSVHSLFRPAQQFCSEQATPEAQLNAAFALALTGKQQGEDYLTDVLDAANKSAELKAIARFYLTGLNLIFNEMRFERQHDPELDQSLVELASCLTESNPDSSLNVQEKIWAVFCPEAVGILSDPKKSVRNLRKKRQATITRANPRPIQEPGEQILFTANALLTIPSNKQNLEKTNLPKAITNQIDRAANEPQQYWYDHPIPIDIPEDQNEILYGLRGLDQALETERLRGNLTGNKLVCVLSVSVTHTGLHAISKQYIEKILTQGKPLKNIDLYIFTEEDTQSLVGQVLAPAAEHYFGTAKAEEVLQVFGVDGHYGRHYSFLKAIAPFWQLLVDDNIQATFKIDLDQVFPQEELINETGYSALEYFKTPFWGAQGIDHNGNNINLGMIAGALVNQSDIRESLFTPDVKLPTEKAKFDQCIFYSKLPQAISTTAEMMYRQQNNKPDKCLQRIHVTGGTNGILIDTLRKYRCFTPSFIARAEDQAYIMSVVDDADDQLAYLHASGLIMRHDKASFAQEVIKSNMIGKLIGDYLRILYFSSYANCFNRKLKDIKHKLSPFTGCFISSVPITTVYLRFCLQAAAYFDRKDFKSGAEFVAMGAKRLSQAIEHTTRDDRPVTKQYLHELRGWNTYYDVLDNLQTGLQKKESFAVKLKAETKALIEKCKIQLS